MKIKNVVIFFAGLISGCCFGVMGILKWSTKHWDVLQGWKKGLIDDIEYLLLGYNTIKTRRYSDFNSYRPGKRQRTNYYTSSYNDYYKRGFREDEEQNNE